MTTDGTIRPRLRFFAVVAAMTASCVMQAAGQQQPPLFRTGIDVVRVDVLVTDKNRPVAGLREDDFEVFDNGVRQHARLITEREAMTLVLALDTSASVKGRKLEDLTKATAAVLDDLRSGDQAALLTFSERLALESAPTGDLSAIRERLPHLTAGGSTALNDALFAGVWLSAQQGQRSLVLAFTDGRDTMSWLTAANVIDSIKRSGALVYGVAVGRPQRSYDLPPGADDWRDDPTMDQAHKDALDKALRPGGTPPTNRAELARDRARMFAGEDDGVGLLRLAAEASGGRVFRPESSGDLKTTFRKVLDEVRARYVLVFTPEGVRRDDGWHRLEVKLADPRKGTITFRPGYFAK